MDDDNRTRIEQSVRTHYSAVARSNGDAGCCAPAAACCAPDYPADELARIPTAAVRSARGCGNPLALASLRPGEVVLDLGSGGGLDVLLAAQRVGREGFVYGLDANPDMLDLARRNASKAGVEHVSFLHGDLEDIPLPDRSVDVILSNCVLNLTLDKSRALGEAWRVLRPGGRLAVSDIVIDPDLRGFTLSEEAIRNRLDWASCSAGALTTADLRAQLEAAGFSDIDLQVLRRMSAEDVTSDSPAGLADLPEADIQQVAARFTSMAITARRPG